jgi:biotin carboxyl carrier protein
VKKKLRELIDFAKKTDLQEVVWEKRGISISFRRRPDLPATASRSAASSTSIPSAKPAVPAGPTVIRSTMVGTFFRSDSPDRPPFVVEGTVVASGQPVAAIEAMKIMKDVTSPASFKILKALVPNGHAVEYGQPLFEVEMLKENV